MFTCCYDISSFILQKNIWLDSGVKTVNRTLSKVLMSFQVPVVSQEEIFVKRQDFLVKTTDNVSTNVWATSASAYLHLPQEETVKLVSNNIVYY